MAYRLPFTKAELGYFLENETVFKRSPTINIDTFIKYFFPEKNRGGKEEAGASESSEEDATGTQNSSVHSPLRRSMAENMTTSITGSTFSGSQKSHQVAEQVKKLDTDLKFKLSNSYTSVRKAFLELDEAHCGYITPEQLAKFLGANKKKNFDFTLMEILVKMQTKGLKTKVSYNDFCTWFGSTIEPTESFFFRHDSKKNPQFDINQKKTEAKTA